MTTTPFIDRVPKDPVENVRWRVAMRRAALGDTELQHALYDACMNDVLFWFNFACWCFEPRARVKVKPFVTWTHQDPVILAMDQAISDSEATESPVDVVLDKSRGQGATWMYLMIFLRRWLRDPFFSAGLVTRNENLVDSAIDPDTLMWKVAWELEMLPPWMLPEGFDPKRHRSLSDHSVMNPENGATIVGYAATGDVASGGRKTVFAKDELAKFKPHEAAAAMDSTQHVTNCRFLVSTHKGDSGVYYDAVNEESNAVKLVLDWYDNPTQNCLAYRMREGIAVAMRLEEQQRVNEYVKTHSNDLKKVERRGHRMEGKLRSPWYDAQCLRPLATPRSIAQELDRDPRGSVGKVFDTEILDRMTERSCRPAMWQGKLVVDPESLEVKGLIRQEGGPLKLWFTPGLDQMPPVSSFVVGCDISAGGTGESSSNSVACGIDRMTGEQVAEYTIMGMPPIQFGRMSVALARWMRGAYLGWETSGIAKPFSKEVMEVLCYGNVYYRDVEEIGSKVKSKKPGWYNGSDEDKGELFETMGLAMESGEFIPRSGEMVKECGEYEWEKGKIVHRPSKSQGMAGKAHGDRCIAGGVAWLLCKDRPTSGLDESETASHNPPYGCWAWREAQEEAQRREWTDESPQFELQDLLRGA